jgi:hypothetical protein
MASTLNVAIAAAAAMLFWTCVGFALTRRLVPASVALPMAPVVGWAVHGAVALPLFLVLHFSAMNVAAVAGLVLIAALAASRMAAPPDDGAAVPAVPAWAYIVAALLAMAPAAAILPKGAGDAVYLADPIFDHAKVAVVDDMMKFGLPAGNPFFAEPRLVYYYLTHFTAAELAVVIGVSGWEADAAMTWFAAAASLALMMGLAVWLGGRMAAILAVALSATASARMVLWWILGENNVDSVIERAGGFAGWLFQSAWVPQHIMSASCVVVAAVLMSRLAARTNALLLVTLALLVAAGFGSSTWVGGVTFAVAAPVVTLALVLRKGPRLRFFAALVGAALLAGLLAAPLLHDQFLAAAARGGGSPLAFQFYPVIQESMPARLRTLLDPPAFWLVLLVFELPAVYVIGMIAMARLAVSRELVPATRRLVAALAALTVASLSVSWLLASTLGGNNDLGWRAILPSVMALTAFAAAGMSRLIAARARVALAVAVVAMVLGVPGAIDLMRGDFAGEPRRSGKLFGETPELWAAVRRHAADDERVGNNPLFMAEMTPWPVNISWALLSDRRACYAGRELALVYTSLSAARLETIDAQFVRIFAGDGSPGDIRDLATTYACRVVVVTPTDGAWGRDPFAASKFYRLAEEKPDRWRIYRATALE